MERGGTPDQEGEGGGPPKQQHALLTYGLQEGKGRGNPQSSEASNPKTKREIGGYRGNVDRTGKRRQHTAPTEG